MKNISWKELSGHIRYGYIYRSAVTTIPIYIKTFSAQIVSGQILTDDIQFIVK